MIVVSYAINEAKSYENGHRLDRMDEVHMGYALEFSHFVNGGFLSLIPLILEIHIVFS